MTITREENVFRTGGLQAVLFDAAHTLFDVTPSVGEVYARSARRYGVDVSGDRVEALFVKHWHALRRLEPHTLKTSEAQERAWWEGLVRRVFADANPTDALQGRFDAFFEELWQAFAHPDVWHVHDDVVPTLETLHEQGLTCAVVSNWDRRLHRLVSGMGLDRHFAFVLTSAEAGWRKPDRRIFEDALRRLEVAPGEALHVGDSLEDDIAGAQAAGIKALLLDRRGKHPKHAPRIRSLAELAGQAKS